MRIILFVFCVLLASSLNAQNLPTAYKNHIDLGTAWGDGNNKFSTNPKTMLGYLTRKCDIREFENSLGHYEMIWIDADTSFSWNERTKKHDVPEYTMAYLNFRNSKKMTEFDKVYITYDSNYTVKGIALIIHETKASEYKLGTFVQQLKAAGFIFDLGSTRLHGALTRSNNTMYCKHKSKVGCTIQYQNDFLSGIKMFK